MAEVIGVIVEIIFRNEDNGFTVLDLVNEADGTLVTAIGTIPFAVEGERVRITGEWSVHPDYGEQIKIEHYESAVPTSLDSLERYLASGLIKGVGPSTAKNLVEHFGLDTLDIIQFYPDRLTEVPGIGPKKAETIAASFYEQKEVREVMLFLQSHGISTNFAVKIYKIYGDQTIPILKENPYRMAQDVVGIGFKTADKIARSMGVEFDSPYRVMAGTKYVLSQAANNGHTYLPREELINNATVLLGVDREMVENAIVSLAINQSITLKETEEHTAVYLQAFYVAESNISKALMELTMAEMSIPVDNLDKVLYDLQKQENIILAQNQKEAVIESLQNGVLVITGGPGTGKTTTINCIIKLFEQLGYEVMLAAPTGRAAKRLSETTGREAKTIHRLLEYGYSGDGELDFFQKDEDNPLEGDVVIVDEMSMVDVLLMNNLLKAIVPGTRLIMVGDVDQLPSVGPGNVLRDIINSGLVKVIRLTEIFRQAQESMIVLNAHRINRGEFPMLNVPDKDFFLDRRQSPKEILETIVDLICRRIPGFGPFDPLMDIQVLSPMKKGLVGVNNLNAELQRVLNPPKPNKNEKASRDMVFREGDKVMQIKNNYNLTWKRYSRGKVIEEGDGVFNGDVGFIESIDNDDREMKVVFDDDKVVVYDFTQLDELELAYAISIHKSQGSEFPVVVIPMAWGPPMLMTRNLLYTAVTRARKMVVLVGREKTIQAMVQNNHITNRYSGLERRLKNLFSTLVVDDKYNVFGGNVFGDNALGDNVFDDAED
ncbi:MAG: ATP-dependent RecD-like DNA helicase [Clostridiales bacterium]|nr:ATP-dependent RecD-like DNA helicase [Clostridiales bacterium]